MGEHDVHFYESDDMKRKILYSNLLIGLNNGCSLLYVSSGEGVESEELSNFGIKVEHPCSLKIVKSDEWYIPDGVLDVNRVVEQYRSFLEESLDRGSNGLYISADVADIFDYLSSDLTSLLNFEITFKSLFEFPIASVCAYRVNQALCSSEIFLQLIQAHEKTITPSGYICNKLALFKTMFNVLCNIFGEHATRIIFLYIEHELRTTRDKFPDRMEDFQRLLEQIYGRELGNRIIDRISKELLLNELKLITRSRVSAF